MQIENHSKKISLPNFLIVGAAKCGTTSVYHYLKQHPDVFMSSIKEPRFITAQFVKFTDKGIGDEKANMKIIRNFEDYCKLFGGSAGKKAIGEATTDYIYYYKDSIKYIKKYLGEPKIIIMLRNPIERAFSAYMFLVRDNRETLSFEDALNEELNRINDEWRSVWFYKDVGFYYEQVKAYMENFNKVKVCFFDILEKDPLSVMKEIYEFLEVDNNFIPNIRIRYNVSGKPRFRRINEFFIRPSRLQTVTRAIGKFILKDDRWVTFRDNLRAKLLIKSDIRPETRRYLRDIFSEDIQRLEILIGHNLSHWYKS